MPEARRHGHITARAPLGRGHERKFDNHDMIRADSAIRAICLARPMMLS